MKLYTLLTLSAFVALLCIPQGGQACRSGIDRSPGPPAADLASE